MEKALLKGPSNPVQVSSRLRAAVAGRGSARCSGRSTGSRLATTHTIHTAVPKSLSTYCYTHNDVEPKKTTTHIIALLRNDTISIMPHEGMAFSAQST